MFEKEIKFIVDYTLNKLRKEVAHVNMGRLLNSSIHPAIIKYCSAEIDNQIKIDRNKLLTGSFFDYSGKEISKYFNLINEEIRKNYKMKSEDLKKLIIKAASFNANYVVRPGWTLAKFIFSDDKERTIKDVLNYFNYIYYYQYQIDVLSAFIQKRKIDSLTKEEFMMITNRIDKEVISSNRKEILKDGVTSIADFFNEGAMSKERISPYLVEYYLRDKKFTEAADIIKKFYPDDDKQKQFVSEIISRLFSAFKEEVPLPVENPVPQSPPSEIEEHSVPEIVSGEDIYSSTLQDLLETEQHSYPDSAETEKFAIDTGEKFKIQVEKNESEITEDTEKDNGIKFVQHSFSIDELRQETPVTEKLPDNFGLKYYVKEDDKQFEDEDTSLQNIGMYNLNKKNDIFSFLSKKEIDRIVESVFNDDQNEFAQTLDKVIECGSFSDASSILKKVFQTFRVNPYSKDAVMLTSAVANYFNQE